MAQFVYSGAAPETTLASDITDSSDAISLASGTGYPSPTDSKLAKITIAPDTSNEEHVYYDTRSGNSLSNCLRGQDASTARQHSAGTPVVHTFVAEEASDLSAHINGVSAAHDAADIANTAAGNIVATTVQAAINELDTEKVAIAATSTASFGFVVDEDDMTSDSATKVPTQQSVKAYVDAAGGSGTSVVTKRAERTGGTITLNSTAWANLDTGLDLTFTDVVAGDVIEVSLSGLWAAEAVDAYIDVVTVVAGSPVNYLSGGAGGAASAGILAWYGTSGVLSAAGGGIQYETVSGDLSAGSLTLRLRYRTSTATNKQLSASANTPLHFSAKNFGQ